MPLVRATSVFLDAPSGSYVGFQSSLLKQAILFLPSTVCSSRVATRNPNFQQLAKDKKLNPNQWEVYLIEFKLCEDTRPDPQLQKAKAQHSMLMSNLNRQGYREVKLHVILVGAMGTIYKDYTEKPLADLNLDYHKIKKLTHKLNENSIRHASALIKQGMHCNITQATTVKDWVRVLRHTTPLTHINFLVIVCAVGGCLVWAPK